MKYFKMFCFNLNYLRVNFHEIKESFRSCQMGIQLISTEFLVGLYLKICIYIYTHTLHLGAWGSVVVKALRYKSEGPGIDSKR